MRIQKYMLDTRYLKYIEFSLNGEKTFISWFFIIKVIKMTIRGAFIAPHGSMILDPEEEPFDTEELHDAMKTVAERIKKLKPDLVFLTSPHGIMLTKDFALYQNERAAGTAEWEGRYQDYSVDIDLDTAETLSLLNYLQEQNMAVTGLTCFSATLEEAPLRWGEAVPLYFLRNIETQYMIMSQPMRRRDATSMNEEALELGRHLARFFDELDKQVIILISADLAHTHQTDHETPYEPSDTAEAFDSAIREWVLAQDLALLEEAGIYSEKALSCGYLGMLVLQGILDNVDLTSKILAMDCPSYYGMLVASFF